MGSRFEADYDGIGEMLRSAAMQTEMNARAGKAKELAEAIAPYDPNNKGAHYRDRFTVERLELPDRVGAKLINDDPGAFQIEHGTSDTPAHHTMLRAMDGMGDG